MNMVYSINVRIKTLMLIKFYKNINYFYFEIYKLKFCNLILLN